ncbi:MAG: AGE family epimerase/isomerase [Pseudomonadota bacterium]
MSAFPAAAARLSSWYRGKVLPLWIERCYAHGDGGFVEALDFEANPLVDMPRRVRVQARQIYTLSRAALLGWHDGAAALAETGFDYFLERCCPDDGARGCVHTLGRDGTVTDDTRDLYDQAFLLLACGWHWKASGDARALALIDKTLDFLDRELAAPTGGFQENDRNGAPRRQNPHMHLFEATTAIFTLTGEQRFAERADAMFALFRDRFFDPGHDVLREFFNADWTPAPGEKGETIEPGHMVEWVWLLRVYESARGVDAGAFKARLYDKAVAVGYAPGTPFLVDAMSMHAAPAPGARRLWPQTEHIKALCARHAAGSADALDDAARLIDACFETYFAQPVEGLWCDRFDAAGAPAADTVPASILYHLIDAVLAVEDAAKTA